MRLDASDQLAQLPALLWNKHATDARLELDTALSRLLIRLSLAGVHPVIAGRVRDVALAFWRSVHLVDHHVEGEVWVVDHSPSEMWTEVPAAVAEILSTNSRIKSW